MKLLKQVKKILYEEDEQQNDAADNDTHCKKVKEEWCDVHFSSFQTEKGHVVGCLCERVTRILHDVGEGVKPSPTDTLDTLAYIVRLLLTPARRDTTPQKEKQRVGEQNSCAASLLRLTNRSCYVDRYTEIGTCHSCSTEHYR